MGRKSNAISLTVEERDYLEIQSRARTISLILLLKADGCSINDIADKVGINRKSVMLCLRKYAEGGVDIALFDALDRGRNAEDHRRRESLDYQTASPARSRRTTDILMRPGHMPG